MAATACRNLHLSPKLHAPVAAQCLHIVVAVAVAAVGAPCRKRHEWPNLHSPVAAQFRHTLLLLLGMKKRRGQALAMQPPQTDT